MAEDSTLLQVDDIVITSSVARFGNITFQIANIDSVSVESVRRMNSVALFSLFFGLGVFVSGIALIGYHSAFSHRGIGTGLATYFFGGALALAAVGLLVQLIWPRRCAKLVLKTSSGDVEALTSDDQVYVASVQKALEDAFAQRVSH